MLPNTTHTHTLAAILFAIVSYIGGYVVWNHLFPLTDVPVGLGHTASISLLPLIGLFITGYVVTYLYTMIPNRHPVMFPLVITMLFVSMTTIPTISVHPVPDTMLIASIVDHLITAFLGVFVIGKVMDTPVVPVTH
jgi:hypothetical protein